MVSECIWKSAKPGTAAERGAAKKRPLQRYGWRFGRQEREALSVLFEEMDGATNLAKILHRKENRKLVESIVNVTYADLFQFCIFVVALISLCYAIFRDKNSRHYRK